MDWYMKYVIYGKEDLTYSLAFLQTVNACVRKGKKKIYEKVICNSVAVDRLNGSRFN